MKYDTLHAKHQLKTMTLRAWPFVTFGTSFEHTWISWSYECPMHSGQWVM